MNRAIRSFEALPAPAQAADWLRRGDELHLVGARREAVLALYLGPVVALLLSLGGLVGLWAMLPPNAPRLFLLGPGLGALLALVWWLYAYRMMRSPRAEAGIHLTQDALASFALERRAAYFYLPWEAVLGARADARGLWARLVPAPRPKGTLLDRELLDEGDAPLRIPSSMPDPERLAAWIDAVRAGLAGPRQAS